MKLMNSFGSTPESFKSKKEEIVQEIKKAKRNISEINLSESRAAWKESAELICFITPTDKMQTINIVKAASKSKDRVLCNDAPPEIQKIFFECPAAVPPKWFKDEYEVKAIEKNPGKPVGVIVRVPSFLKGLTVAEYLKIIESDVNPTKNWDGSVDVDLMPFTDFEQKMILIGENKIKGAKETLLPGTTATDYQLLFSPVKDGIFSKKLIRVDQGNKSILHERNYLPLSCYETVNLTKPMSTEELLALNTAAFSDLFNADKKFSDLKPENKEHIRKVGDKITSDYITNGTNRVDLTVTAFYDKNIVKSLTSLPLPSKSGYVKYSLLDDKMIDRAYALKTAIADPRFAHIIAAAKEVLSINKLRTMFGKMEIAEDEVAEVADEK